MLPPLCPNIGDVCDDGNAGTVNDPRFAGFIVYTDPNSADYGKCMRLYSRGTDQGTGNQWKTGTGVNDIATDSYEDGKLNDSQVPDSATFPAFKLCKDQTDGGFTDWYLPAQEEALILWQNRTALGGFSASNYRTSTEMDLTYAYGQSFNDGTMNQLSKTSNHRVRCVRRD